MSTSVVWRPIGVFAKNTGAILALSLSSSGSVVRLQPNECLKNAPRCWRFNWQSIGQRHLPVIEGPSPLECFRGIS